MLSELEKKVISSIQEDIPVTQNPYRKIAEKLALSEEMLLTILKGLSEKGVTRRFGATLRHQKTGFSANAMVAWKVAEERMESTGEKMAASPHISHCYRRNPNESWPYNLYTMIHAQDTESCKSIAQALALDTGINEYQLLFSRRELKKTSMKYFQPE
jgi:siroheme decarboxylase